ncbi:hypothetical protein BKP64_10950 [Marinobacter salinus]|uniref:Uncharacterized protein n=1 Tax=Marinobacter salinus TaxID=1874317 RepID=A0A1D9GLX9_9GAMM|nr:hypothetical protein [Marinobacter salinus]AOY88646.1 hypothetical protein BKP64_10950 [Marinobacter salinus]
MNSNVPMTTRTPLVATLAPSSQAVGARSTGWLSVSEYFSFMALVQAGALGASGTVDAKIEQAQDAAGTGAKDVTSKAATQIAASNKTAAISLGHNDMDTTNGFTHIRLTVTVGTAASQTSASVFAADARYEKPANNQADEVV